MQMETDSEDLRSVAKTFNLGNHDVKVTENRVVVSGKTSQSWGKDVAFQRSKTEAHLEVVSKKPLLMVYISYLFYALGFLLIFVEDGVSVPTQMRLFVIAIVLLLTPLAMYFILPLKPFILGAAIFYVVIFSFSGFEYLEMAFEIVEDVVGAGYVESFIMGAAMLPILLHLMVSQTMITYRLRLQDEDTSFEVISRGSPAKRLVDYMKRDYLEKSWPDVLRRLFEFRIPLFFLRLSSERMKRCQ